MRVIVIDGGKMDGLIIRPAIHLSITIVDHFTADSDFYPGDPAAIALHIE